MSLDAIIGGYGQYQRLQSSSRDDDCVDHLNHIYTVIILVILATFVSGKQYVGNPIECFSEDMEFGYAKREYARTYCWLKNTYKVGKGLSLPREDVDRKNAEIPYYQWVPIILLVLAVMFKLPNLLWRLSSSSCGLNITQLSSLVNDSQLLGPAEAKDSLHQVAEYMDRWLSSNHIYQMRTRSRFDQAVTKACKCFFFWGKSNGTYLTGLYLLTKFFFLANSVAVFLLLWNVLGTWYFEFGVRVLQGTRGPLVTDERGFAWPELPYFPKLTFCDFTVRHQSNINTHTMQCALPINMFNEKIFGFLWFWITFVTVTNLMSFLVWIYKFYFGCLHGRHIQHLLENHGDLITDYDRHLALNFGKNYLRRDGCFVIQVILNNSNALVTGDLLSKLFGIYRSRSCLKKEKGCGDIMYI